MTSPKKSDTQWSQSCPAQSHPDERAQRVAQSACQNGGNQHAAPALGSSHASYGGRTWEGTGSIATCMWDHVSASEGAVRCCDVRGTWKTCSSTTHALKTDGLTASLTTNTSNDARAVADAPSGLCGPMYSGTSPRDEMLVSRQYDVHGNCWSESRLVTVN